jgi:hypothetical protein
MSAGFIFSHSYPTRTTARAIYGENMWNFDENPALTKTRNAFGAARHTIPFDRVADDKYMVGNRFFCIECEN